MSLNYKQIGFIAGLLAFTILLYIPKPDGMTSEGQSIMAIAALMALWWIFEALPLAVTSLLPLVLYPVLGVMDTPSAAAPFAHHVNFLILGGFFIGLTIEKWNLHQRIALSIIYRIGSSSSAIMLGFMIASFVLSMWISNVATALMMVPIGMAVTDQFIKIRSGKTDERTKVKFGLGLMLSIAYAGNLGGMSTLIGTPCNALLAGMVNDIYGQEINFLDWFKLAFPFGIVMLIVTWIYLSKVAFKVNWGQSYEGHKMIGDQLKSLGPVTKAEKYALTILILTAISWVLRSMVTIAWVKSINDATIAIFFGITAFMVPVDWKKKTFLLDWKTTKKLPWGILLLMGGGLTLAKGINETQLDAWMISQLVSLENSSLFIIILTIVIFTIFFTEITSNTAAVSVMIPLLSSLATAIGVHPYAIIMSAGMAVSFAFMLPMATPGNSVIFSSPYVTVPKMARTGFILNVIGIVLIPILILVVLPKVWDINILILPEWAK